jgi:serine protease AprX
VQDLHTSHDKPSPADAVETHRSDSSAGAYHAIAPGWLQCGSPFAVELVMRTRCLSVLNGVLPVLAVATCLALTSVPLSAQAGTSSSKLDDVLKLRTGDLRGRSRVIVEYVDVEDVRAITQQNGHAIRHLAGAHAHVADVDNKSLDALAADPRVAHVMVDRPAFTTMFRTGRTTGATIAREVFGVTGKGIGVALIDSGITGWHDDLYLGPDGANHIAYFKDFTRPDGDPLASVPSDDYGHGTHVAGIIAGSGYDSGGARMGMAPDAHLIGLKVLDADGQGYISDVIAAFDLAIQIKDIYNIRVINLSVASGVFESYNRDPLTLAAKRATDAGIVVVAAAGNLGLNDDGQVQYGGITAPGNAPWVLTVGASNHQGTAKRSDDTIADFSSRGPTWIDFAAKPDIVAPGVGIESTAAYGSTLATTYADYLVGTPNANGLKPYLSLSGTSMSAPVVAGAVALLLEAHPSLTPNAVKAILQYTAQVKDGESTLAQGAGMLNVLGALRLAQFFEAPAESLETVDQIEGESIPWSRQILWGNYRIAGGVPLAGANAWALDVTWGSMSAENNHSHNNTIAWGARTADDDGVQLELDGDAFVIAASDRRNIVWATADRRNIVWATGDRHNIVWATGDRRNIVWATGDRRNIVWATGDRRNIVWATGDRRNIVWATGDRRNIVWATTDRRNIVWATALGENVVWGDDCGGADCQRAIWGLEEGGTVWGTAASTDNVVWTTADRRNIVWATADRRNIVWATGDRRNIVWATADRRNIVWATTDRRNIVWATGAEGAEAVWAAAAPDAVLWPEGSR